MTTAADIVNRALQARQLKACTKCGEEKDVGLFAVEKGQIASQCRACRAAKARDWRSRNPTAAQAAWGKSNAMAKEARRRAREQRGLPAIPPKETSDGRHCSGCRTRKPRDQFNWHRDTNRRDQLNAHCKECSRAKMQEKKYGLPKAEILEMWEKQNRKCAICRDPVKLGGRGCGVDHRHSDGMVRGILCILCNTGIGMFKDDPTRMEFAIKYVRREVVP